MIVQTARQNERDKRERIDNKTISSAILQVNDRSRYSQNNQRRSMVIRWLSLILFQEKIAFVTSKQIIKW